MKTALICFSDAGAALALRLKETLGNEISGIHSTVKFAEKYGFIPHSKVSDDVGQLFSENSALIFISACGIAVRSIAPYLKDKTSDPAVLVMDDKSRFVIPILSGHIGGANELAKEIAAMTGAVPVITTATDGGGRFSCDAWASRHGCAISSMDIAKKISAAILTSDVPVSSEFDLPETLPSGLVRSDSGELGIYIGIREESPYKITLRLVPKIVTVGIGCRRGISAYTVEEAVKAVFSDSGICLNSVEKISTIDVKKDEAGLLSYAESMNVPIEFHTAVELDSVEGDFEESEFVRKTVGTGNVCERAAAFGGGSLIIRKTALNGVTVAAAAREWRIEF